MLLRLFDDDTPLQYPTEKFNQSRTETVEAVEDDDPNVLEEPEAAEEAQVHLLDI